MKRRRLISLIGASAIPLAGCLDRSCPDGQPDEGPTSPAPTESPQPRLTIRSVADTTLAVKFKLFHLSGNCEAYDRTHTFGRLDEVTLDRHFTPGTDYRFELRIDDTVVFERIIYSYEGYVLAIRSREEVDIVEYVERSSQ